MNWDSIKFFYADHFEVPLKSGHRFPMEKYQKLREDLVSDGVISASNLYASELIDRDLLLLAHTEEYVNSVLELSLDHTKARKVGLPLTEVMVKRARASADAFTKAVDESLLKGFSASLAGGTHHAHSNEGEGFCYFNDFAINTRKLGQLYPTKKILILDLDVHQGNGNSSILKEDLNVFIVSFHGEKNYPFKKVPSHIDVALKPGTNDDEYLEKLAATLVTLAKMNFDHIFYQAGVDTLEGDRFGSLSLSHQGLIDRDRMVFEIAKKLNIPIVVAMGGGYHEDVSQTVLAYKNIFKTAKEVFGRE